MGADGGTRQRRARVSATAGSMVTALSLAALCVAVLLPAAVLTGCGGSDPVPTDAGSSATASGVGAQDAGSPAPSPVVPSPEGDVPPLICGVASPPRAPASPESGPPVTLTDRTQVVWDISTAVYTYGFDRDGFEYGLGLGAIAPVNDPRFLEPGDADYPDADDDTDVIGLEIGAEVRAYPVRAVTFHEIVNDRLGDAYVSVSY